MEEKRDEDLLEEDELEEDIIEEVVDSDRPKNDVGRAGASDKSDAGHVAEDAVKKSDTISSLDKKNHEHEYVPVPNKEKPWESRNREFSEVGGDSNSSADYISIDKKDFWIYVKILVGIVVLILGYNYFFAA